MMLDKVKRGDLVKIVSIGETVVWENALRMGIDEGSILVCVEVVPAGPIVLRKHRQEVAIGRSLARNITVELLARAGEAGEDCSNLTGEMC